MKLPNIKIKKTVKIKTPLIIALALALVVTLSMLTYFIVYTQSYNIRKDRILSILSSLNIDDKKCFNRGEFMRGSSSMMNWMETQGTVYTKSYSCADKVDVTTAYIKDLATKAGLVYVGEPYPGGAAGTYDYRTDKYEYIRIYISSKVRDDVFYNRFHMGLELGEDTDTLTNEGPANVMIVINLDGIN